jgi:hypothetical protein
VIRLRQQPIAARFAQTSGVGILVSVESEMTIDHFNGHLKVVAGFIR